MQILGIREHGEWMERAAEYFAERWGIDRELYLKSMARSILVQGPVPRWYIAVREGKILGGCGLIENDFMKDTRLGPWLCALYVEREARGQSLGGRLLDHCRMDVHGSGVEKLYLNTDHVGYYEKYGWRFVGGQEHESGDMVRVYEADTLPRLEEMASFFDARAQGYDSHMLEDLELKPFYGEIADCFQGRKVDRLLDIGCGTGLELEGLFAAHPDMEVVGVDLSGEMLDRLRAKFQDKRMRLIQGSYFEADFETGYDAALSTYSLHHFSEAEKLGLYRKIHGALCSGGLFVWGDYTVGTQARQEELMRANARIRRANGIKEGAFYHFDIPFTAELEMKLLRQAGFSNVVLGRRWENTSIITALK